MAFALALYPVADPLARYRYALTREHEPPPPSGFDAKRLIASHRAFFADEAAMASASVTRIVSSGEATALPPAWVAQPELDDNVPAEITEALVRAYQAAGGHMERAHFPGARHGFIQQASPDTDKAIALMQGLHRQPARGRRERGERAGSRATLSASPRRSEAGAAPLAPGGGGAASPGRVAGR